MGFAKAKSQTRTTNTTMTTHQEATASSHEPEKLSLAVVQVARGTHAPKPPRLQHARHLAATA